MCAGARCSEGPRRHHQPAAGPRLGARERERDWESTGCAAGRHGRSQSGTRTGTSELGLSGGNCLLVSRVLKERRRASRIMEILVQSGIWRWDVCRGSMTLNYLVPSLQSKPLMQKVVKLPCSLCRWWRVYWTLKMNSWQCRWTRMTLSGEKLVPFCFRFDECQLLPPNFWTLL